MLIKLSASVLALASTILLAMPARADVISGTFAGIATSGTFRVPNNDLPADVTGSAVSGTFDVTSVAGATPINLGPNYVGAYFLPLNAISYSFTVASINQTFSFTSNFTSPVVQLFDYGDEQALFLAVGLAVPHLSADIVLTGPELSLFNSINDIASLHAGPGVTVQSPLFFGVYYDGGATVNVTSTSFASQAVPEPSSAAVLALPLTVIAAAALLRRRRPQQRLAG